MPSSHACLQVKNEEVSEPETTEISATLEELRHQLRIRGLRVRRISSKALLVTA